eukprot:10545818-Alexandrium_andersonii.AAC.1
MVITFEAGAESADVRWCSVPLDLVKPRTGLNGLRLVSIHLNSQKAKKRDAAPRILTEVLTEAHE